MGKGGWEIERRFLVRSEPALEGRLGSGERYRQGYVATGSPSVRIRIGEARGPVLTLKSGTGRKRREVETVVPLDVGEALLEAAGRRVVYKTRWRLGRWELDRFEGGLEGLEILEIELDEADDPLPPWPSDIFIMSEVTEDNRFTSSGLAKLTPGEQIQFVRDAYREGLEA